MFKKLKAMKYITASFIMGAVFFLTAEPVSAKTIGVSAVVQRSIFAQYDQLTFKLPPRFSKTITKNDLEREKFATINTNYDVSNYNTVGSLMEKKIRVVAFGTAGKKSFECLLRNSNDANKSLHTDDLNKGVISGLTLFVTEENKTPTCKANLVIMMR